MEKSFIETWQESAKSLAGLFKQVSDKNVALTQTLYSNLASKQWSKMTQAAMEMTKGMGAAGDNKLTVPKIAFSLQTPTDSDIRSFKEFIEIYQAAFENICDSQFSLSQSYIDLASAYAENLKKSRDIDDVVATNFDYLSNLMMMVKNGTLDSLEVGDSIKTALVAWAENSLPVPANHPRSVH